MARVSTVMRTKQALWKMAGITNGGDITLVRNTDGQWHMLRPAFYTV